MPADTKRSKTSRPDTASDSSFPKLTVRYTTKLNLDKTSQLGNIIFDDDDIGKPRGPIAMELAKLNGRYKPGKKSQT